MKRKSNIELLRIIAMFMIVMHHFMIHGVLRNAYNGAPLIVNTTKIIADLCESGGKLGVDIFLMISGYFLIRSTPKFKKIFMLLAQVWFYSMLFFIINLFLHIIPLNRGLVVSSIFPFSYETYWFVTMYVIIYLFSPYLNRYLLSIDRKQFRNFLFLLILVAIIIPTFLPRSIQMAWPLLACLTFYVTGAYVRLFVNDNLVMKKKGKILSILMILFCVSTVIGFNLIGKVMKINVISINATYFTINNSSLALYLLSAGLLLWFRGINMGSHKSINLIAGTTFGVYLIHENPIVSHWLWNNFIPTLKYLDYTPTQFVAKVLSVSIFIYMGCTMIELARQRVFQIIGLIKNKCIMKY